MFQESEGTKEFVWAGYSQQKAARREEQ